MHLALFDDSDKKGQLCHHDNWCTVCNTCTSTVASLSLDLSVPSSPAVPEPVRPPGFESTAECCYRRPGVGGKHPTTCSPGDRRPRASGGMADALASGASVLRDVGVQVPLRPPRAQAHRTRPDRGQAIWSFLFGVRRRRGRTRRRPLPADRRSPGSDTGAGSVGGPPPCRRRRLLDELTAPARARGAEHRRAGHVAGATAAAPDADAPLPAPSVVRVK